MTGSTQIRIAMLQLVVLAALAGCAPTTERAPAPKTANASLALPKLVASDATFPELEQAFRQHRSHVWVDGGGTVTRLLRDDTKRPRHQRFVVRVGNGPRSFTVLIAHNIDQASRVPLKKGDPVTFRGEYIWGEQGGTVHWTHRDKKRGKEGGWIRWRDFVYR
jgi:hypothetical protein